MTVSVDLDRLERLADNGMPENFTVEIGSLELSALVRAVRAARDLYERVEMDESVGVCLSSRVEALNLDAALAPFRGPALGEPGTGGSRSAAGRAQSSGAYPSGSPSAEDAG